MFEHMGFVVRDLEKSKQFYQAVLEPLGVRLYEDHSQGDGTGWLVFGTGKPQAPFFVVAGGRPTFWNATHEPAKSPIHVAFIAPSKEGVDRFMPSAWNSERKTMVTPACVACRTIVRS